jgi:hypothetical protein
VLIDVANLVTLSKSPELQRTSQVAVAKHVEITKLKFRSGVKKREESAKLLCIIIFTPIYCCGKEVQRNWNLSALRTYLSEWSLPIRESSAPLLAQSDRVKTPSMQQGMRKPIKTCTFVISHPPTAPTIVRSCPAPLKAEPAKPQVLSRTFIWHTSVAIHG